MRSNPGLILIKGLPWGIQEQRNRYTKGLINYVCQFKHMEQYGCGASMWWNKIVENMKIT